MVIVVKKWILAFNNKDLTHPEAGGGTFLLHRFLKRLAKEGYEVILISSNYKGAKKIEIIDGLKIIRIGTLSTVFLKSIFLAKKIIDLKQFKPEVIIDSALLGIPFMTPIFFPKIPIIAFYYHLEGNVFIEELKLKYGSILGSLIGHTLIEYENRLLSSIYKKENVLNITFSRPTYEEMLQKGFKERNTKWFQEGIELDKYPLSLIKKRKRKKQFVYVGRLKKYKGIFDLIKGFELALNDGLSNEFQLHVLGDGPLKPLLERYITTHKLNRNIILHGFVPHHLKLEYLRDSIAVISPSWKEGWATPITEGNVLGTPGIASDATGVKEATFNGKTGIVFKKGNINDLKEKILIMATSPTLVEQLGKNGVDIARNLDWKKLEENLLEVMKHHIQKTIKKRNVNKLPIKHKNRL